MQDVRENKTRPHEERRSVDLASYALGVFVALSVALVAGTGVHFVSNRASGTSPIISPSGDIARLIAENDTYLWDITRNLQGERVEGFTDGKRIEYTVTTNDLGLRGGPVETKGSRYRILAIGDSTTFGQYVNDDQTWPAQLQRLLDPSRKWIDVINAGIIGASSFQGLSYLANSGMALQPDLVVATYGFNDKAMMAYSDREMARMTRARVMAAMVLDTVKTALGRGVLPAATRPRATPGEYTDHLLQMKALCHEHGVALAFIIWPDRSQSATFPEREHSLHQVLLRGVASATQSPCVDLIAPFLKEPEKTFLDYVHASPYGCQIVAEQLAAEVRRQFSQGLAETWTRQHLDAASRQLEAGDMESSSEICQALVSLGVPAQQVRSILAKVQMQEQSSEHAGN